MNGTGVPGRGDLVWIDLDPRTGREQAGYRPALILSPASYNRRAGLAVVCPVTSRAKGYPFEVPLPAGLPIAGVILVDHLRSIDWAARQARAVGTVPTPVLAHVSALVRRLLTL